MAWNDSWFDILSRRNRNNVDTSYRDAPEYQESLAQINERNRRIKTKLGITQASFDKLGYQGAKDVLQKARIMVGRIPGMTLPSAYQKLKEHDFNLDDTLASYIIPRSKSVDEVISEPFDPFPSDVDTTSTVTETTGTPPTSPATQPQVEQAPVIQSQPNQMLSLDELARAIMAGKYGNGATRRQALTNAGYTADEIAKAQQLVNRSMPRARPANSVDAVISSSMPDVVTAYQRGAATPNVSSGYATGHEAYYDPIAGQLRFR